MITYAIDDKLTVARQTVSLMNEIDPSGTHEAIKDVKEALSKIEETHPDIVWLDVEMPRMNGLEMAIKIKTLSPDTNIVFVTGHPEYALDAHKLHVSGFILKPVTAEQLQAEIENLRRPVEGIPGGDKGRLKVVCFGNFEVFSANGKPVHFTRQKSKEAFAYLVDRKGAGVSVNELCTILWEEREADSGLKAQCRAIMRSLKLDLIKAGAGSVIGKDWNAWNIYRDKIECDYYDFLNGDVKSVNSFRGEYMTQYSWAEMTAGALYDSAGDYLDI